MKELIEPEDNGLGRLQSRFVAGICLLSFSLSVACGGIWLWYVVGNLAG